MRTFVIALSLLILSLSGLVFINAIKLPVDNPAIQSRIGQIDIENISPNNKNTEDTENIRNPESEQTTTDRPQPKRLPKVIEAPEERPLGPLDKEIETEIKPTNPAPEDNVVVVPDPDENVAEGRNTDESVAAEPVPKERVVAVFDGETFNTSEILIDKNLIGEIKRIVKEVNSSPNSRVVVEGHTDNVPVRYPNIHFSDNMELSVHRATNTANILVQHGVSRKKISVIGYGASRPVAANGTDFGSIKNRRVEIKIISNDKES